MNSKLRLTVMILLLFVLGGGAGATAGQVTQASGGQQGQSGQGQAPSQMKLDGAPAVPTGSGFTYQGRLVLDGSPATGSFDFTFNLFDAATGGNQIGSTLTMLNQTLSIGTFSVSLDFGSNAFQGDARWLQIGVRPSGQPTYTILSPRQALTPAPYALSLRPGAIISGSASTGLQVSTTGGTGLYASGNTGAYINSLGFYGLYATSVNTGSLAVFGYTTGYQATGVQGTSAGNGGIGVEAYGNTGNGYGVYGNGFYGVYGYGNRGVTAVGTNFGLFADSTNIGASISGDNEAIYASSVSTYGITIDVSNSGTNGYGIFSSGSNSQGIGVRGAGHYGVIGDTTNGYALTGYGGSGYGIYANGGTYAGYFSGNVNVTGGCCAAGQGTFRIDDPTDPANKYLNQAAVESPDMMSIYNGNVTTDAKGEAVVTLPDYFEALNQDFRYQLTPIGQFAQAIVSEEIKDNRFTIKTDKPNVKVSWQVTGIRHDPYAQQHHITAEQDKTGDDTGKYLYPAAYGQPDSAGIDYAKNQLPPAPQQPQQGQAPKLPPRHQPADPPAAP